MFHPPSSFFKLKQKLCVLLQETASGFTVNLSSHSKYFSGEAVWWVNHLVCFFVFCDYVVFHCCSRSDSPHVCWYTRAQVLLDNKFFSCLCSVNKVPAVSNSIVILV